MQACVTKWFKPMDPAKHAQYHEWLFEKEKMDRQKKQEERDARIKAVRDHGEVAIERSSFLTHSIFLV